MPVDKGSERGEQRPLDDWERIGAEQAQRDAAQRKYDETHDPGEVWEASARRLPEDYGKDRPASRTVSQEDIDEMVGLWGQEAVDKRLASGKLVLEGSERQEIPSPGRDPARASDHSPETSGQGDGSDRGGPGDAPPPAGEFADGESRDQPASRYDRAGETNGWDHVGGERPDRENIHVNESRQTYILDGNGRGGGGHFPGTGLPNKTEYPASWDDQKIIGSIEDVARNPDYPPELQENGRWKVRGTRDGVDMTVIVNPDSAVYSAFPRHGRGVIQNDEHGNPKPAPTER